jgi:hypothetical protein
MSTLTYREEFAPAAPAEAATPQRASFWRRLWASFIASQQRRAEREIAHFIASRGGAFTDATEREIMHRLLSGRRSF